MNQVRCNLRHGQEYEGTLGHARVRQLKISGAQNEIAVEEQVEVEGARSLGNAVGAVAAEGAFDFEEVVEQGLRPERRFEGDGGVEESGLVGVSDWLGLEVRGFGCEAAQFGELEDGRVEGLAGRSGGAGKVGAEGEVGGFHKI